MILLARLQKPYRIVLLALLLILPAALVQAVAIMPVDQVRPGMQGVGKTVVAGTQIEEFGVEVLGVMKDKGPSGDLILVRTYGDVIERTGGIAQGMSGSPVYIDGKLVGAIAYGWSLTDHRIGMVTPIADMLKLWEMPDKANSWASPPLLADARPVATPVMAAGFGERALAMLAEKLKPFNLVPYAVGSADPGASQDRLEPGSAVGIELVRGDVSLGAIGTVTYVEGDKVLAFGHPFLKKGNTNFFLTDAYVFTTVKGVENSFKVGVTGSLLGTINQDRGAGVAGITGRYPSVIPVRIIVKDSSAGKTTDAAVQIVQDEQLAPILTATTVFNFIEKTMDRVGPGSARVTFEVSGRNLPDETLRRENMFYSPVNIGEAAVGELYEALALVADNKFTPVELMDVKVNVDVTAERRTATIMEARANVATAKPGDKIDITVKLKPYREEPITRVVSFVIPKDQPAGPLTLEVRGGGTVPLMYGLLKDQGLEGELARVEKNKHRTFADVVRDVVERDRNNDIVVEILDVDLSQLGSGLAGSQTNRLKLGHDPQPAGDKTNQPSRARGPLGDFLKKSEENRTKYHITTDYIIDSDAQVMIEVVKDEGK
ncbi:SpoIVB peptidase S55 domain-containing protein [Thermosinus carboxydivorans]|uniref:SpoIVB peptidase S55 domain-containing protein n=1 Tax=Thermosinus carboxydivorans TaxID=261685 RepID=UPI000594834E